MTAHIVQAITHDTSEQNWVWLRETNITGQLLLNHASMLPSYYIIEIGCCSIDDYCIASQLPAQ